jgi:hypothetical protein
LTIGFDPSEKFKNPSKSTEKQVATPVRTKVARWYFYKPRIPFLKIFGGPWNGECWYILRTFGTYVLRPVGKHT